MVSFRGMTGSKERTWEMVLPSPIAKITHLCRCLHFIPLILSLNPPWLASSPDETSAQNTAFPPGSPCSTSTTLSGKVWSQPPYFPSTSSPDNSAHTPFPSATLHFLILPPIRHRDSGKIIPQESQLLQHNTFSQDSKTWHQPYKEKSKNLQGRCLGCSGGQPKKNSTKSTEHCRSIRFTARQHFFPAHSLHSSASVSSLSLCILQARIIKGKCDPSLFSFHQPPVQQNSENKSIGKVLISFSLNIGLLSRPGRSLVSAELKSLEKKEWETSSVWKIKFWVTQTDKKIKISVLATLKSRIPP